MRRLKRDLTNGLPEWVAEQAAESIAALIDAKIMGTETAKAKFKGYDGGSLTVSDVITEVACCILLCDTPIERVSLRDAPEGTDKVALRAALMELALRGWVKLGNHWYCPKHTGHSKFVETFTLGRKVITIKAIHPILSCYPSIPIGKIGRVTTTSVKSDDGKSEYLVGVKFDDSFREVWCPADSIMTTIEPTIPPTPEGWQMGDEVPIGDSAHVVRTDLFGKPSYYRSTHRPAQWVDDPREATQFGSKIAAGTAVVQIRRWFVGACSVSSLRLADELFGYHANYKIIKPTDGSLTVADLRRAMEKLPDDMPVAVLASEPNRVTLASVHTVHSSQFNITQHVFMLRCGDEVLLHQKDLAK
jgi:hypothetical protein